MNNATNLFVISAPSGAGKTSLLKKLINRNNKLRYSISYTTRTPRKNETHGQDYFFVSTNVFNELEENGELKIDSDPLIDPADLYK